MSDNVLACGSNSFCGIPLAAMYTYYHVRKLRSEERLAALPRVNLTIISSEPSTPYRKKRKDRQ
jgi:hypothetical protein